MINVDGYPVPILNDTENIIVSTSERPILLVRDTPRNTTTIYSNVISTNRTNSQTESMLIEVQKKMFGQRSEKLTPIEINRLFQSPITPEFNLTIYRALQRKVIDPDIAILQAIPRATTREYLIPIALCLRYGADANMYVDAPKLGTIHILGYVYNILGGDRFKNTTDVADESVLNTIILMLVAEGSRSSLPMYDKRAGKIRTIDDRDISSSLSVTEWLNDQGYNTILNRVNIGDSSELQKFVDKDSLSILSILLDKSVLMGRDYEARDMFLAIRAYSLVSIDKIPTPDTIIMLDYKSLDDAVNHLNAAAFDKLIKRGQIPSYILINKIIIGMKTYRNTGRIIVVQELEQMLLISVSVGVQLDQDQLSIISSMGQDVLTSVSREYEQPYWRKICKASTDSDTKFSNISHSPNQLRRLAISLNIDPNMSKTALCDTINILSKADKEALKEAARKRQQLRISADMGTTNDFLGGKIPNLVCRNKTLLPHDPYDYNDIDIAYYRDDQGTVWCFTSDAFTNILETGINPYNSTVLPDTFKEQLRYRINLLKRLGIDANRGEVGVYATRLASTPVTFSSSIDSLTNKDMINEKSSEQALDLFVQLASRNGISSETIKSLTKENMMNALRSVNYDINLTQLSTSHALITTARIVEYMNYTNPDNVKIFFSSLGVNSSFI